MKNLTRAVPVVLALTMLLGASAWGAVSASWTDAAGSHVVQLLNVKPALGASALTFAVIFHESPLPIFPVLAPLMSPVPEVMAPPPLEQLVEPMKICWVKPNFCGLVEPGQATDLIFRAPSVNVVCAVQPED